MLEEIDSRIEALKIQEKKINRNFIIDASAVLGSGTVGGGEILFMVGQKSMDNLQIGCMVATGVYVVGSVLVAAWRARQYSKTIAHIDQLESQKLILSAT